MPLPPEPPPEQQVEQCDFTGGEVAAAPPAKPKHKSVEVELDQEMLDMLEPEDRAILAELDGDGSGKVELHEVLGLVRAHKEQQKTESKMFKTFFGIVAFLVACLGANTIATFMVVELAKENKVPKGGTAMTSAATGKTVDMGNNDMGVDKTGKLVPKKTVNGSRRLAKDSGGAKTTPGLAKTELASSLPDKTLMAMEQMTVYSDKGFTLQFQIQGFSRVPALNTRCGSLVTFYTAWKGMLTLDSTTLSFDEATAKEFKNAGFSLAVGGAGGRRLAGKSKSDGFFKDLASVKNSGKWKCAGVPLPEMTDQNIQKTSIYLPCGTSDPKKKVPDQCDSAYGGFVPGAKYLEKRHAMAAKSKTARLRAILQKSDPKVVYAQTYSEVFRSAKYQVTISTQENTVGQEEVTVFDRESKASATFQVVVGDTSKRSHCKASTDDAAGSMEKASKDKSVDSDMHFEYMGLMEEEGSTLRHFRMMTADSFTKFMGAGGTRPTDAYTEYWDYADTLTPYRILSGDGSITVFDKLTPKCSEDDLKAGLAKRTKLDVAELFKCSEVEKGNQKGRPEIHGPYSDLDIQAQGFYTEINFNDTEGVKAVAANDEDTSIRAKFARYLRKTTNRVAMFDICYAKCKEGVDQVLKDDNWGKDTCEAGSLTAALKCLQESGISSCQNSNFYVNHYEECPGPGVPKAGVGENKTAALDRRLEDDEDTRSRPETLVPVRTLPDGTQEADLGKSPVEFQAQVTKKLGKHMGQARLVFNATNDVAYLETATPSQSRRAALSGRCLSKYFYTMWKGDGWCMAYEFEPKDFTLTIAWGWIGGYMGMSITCEACIDLAKIWGIPPPVACDFCVGGEIWVSGRRSCPYIGMSAGGKVYWYLALSANFGVLKVTIGKLEIGILAAIAYFDKAVHCWWGGGDGRRRRRWWSRRRRYWKRCNYRKECDLKIAAYVDLRVGSCKARLEESYWVRHKCMTVSLGFYVYEFWKAWWGKWRKVYYTEVARYYFR